MFVSKIVNAARAFLIAGAVLAGSGALMACDPSSEHGDLESVENRVDEIRMLFAENLEYIESNVLSGGHALSDSVEFKRASIEFYRDRLGEESDAFIFIRDILSSPTATELPNLASDDALPEALRSIKDETEALAERSASFESFEQGLESLRTRAGKADLPFEEREMVLTYLALMQEGMRFLNDHIQGTSVFATDVDSFGSVQIIGWWRAWGRCAAGTLGGAITGGLTGAAAGSVLPGVGTGLGGVAGAVGGGLTGAAATCV